MTDPRWFSEPFPPGGGMSAEGVRNQLGRPNLSPLEVLVRETIQNSWDARRSDSGISFEFVGAMCTQDHARALRKYLSLGVPADPLPLKASLSDELCVLTVSDRGTTGLGGPTRADVHNNVSEAHDFAAFVRNVGEPADKEHSAGTFGFGKSSLFAISNARTILVYTRCMHANQLETRLIGIAVGNSFRLPEGDRHRSYTGRHYWGCFTDEVVEPLIDDEADEVAKEIGFVPFPNDELGTTVMIINPKLGEPLKGMQSIAAAIAWHAWPKLLPGASGGPDIHCSVLWNGAEIEIPDPQQTPPLDGFVEAYLQLPVSGEAIECRRPAQLLGHLSLNRRLVRARPASSETFVPPIDSPVHHVALIRTPGFVVNYLAGPPLPAEEVEYAGVFRVTDEVDKSFATAEPPTHDDWVPAHLEGTDRVFVVSALSRLRERLRDFARPRVVETVGTSRLPLGSASSLFASLVATTKGTGGSGLSTRPVGAAGTDRRGSGGGVGGRGTNNPGAGAPGSRTQPAGDPEFGEFAGQSVIFFPVRILRALENAVVTPTAHVVLDEGTQAEKDLPSGASHPRILGWLGPQGEQVLTPTLSASGKDGEVWRVAVIPARNTMTGVTYQLTQETQ